MRVLFFLQPGANSRQIFQDMIRGFERAGHEALVLEMGPIWKAYTDNAAGKAQLMTVTTERVRDLIRSQGIELCVGMWGNTLSTFMNTTQDGVPRTMFDVIGVPHLLFWLDAPHWAQSGSIAPIFRSPILSGPTMTHLINNPATAAEMTGVLGFGRTIAAPYAIDEGVFKPVAGVGRDYDVVMCVGPGDPGPTALALRELESDEPDVGALRREAAEGTKRELGAMAAEVLGARGGADGPGAADAHESLRAALMAVLESQLASRHIPMLERVMALAESGPVAKGAQMLLGDPRLYVRATMAIRGVEAWERPFVASYLSRRLRCAVFGENNLAAWGFRGEHLGSPAHEEQSAVYSRGRLAVNLMRWQDDAGLNLKPYEITASGVACLCVRRAWLERSFVEGREVVTFDGPREAHEQAGALLDDEARRAAIAGAGLERTRREHTWARRAAELLGVMAARRSG